MQMFFASDVGAKKDRWGGWDGMRVKKEGVAECATPVGTKI